MKHINNDQIVILIKYKVGVTGTGLSGARISGITLLITILDVGIRERNQEAGEVSREDDYLQRGQSFTIS